MKKNSPKKNSKEENFVKKIFNLQDFLFDDMKMSKTN
jgi:hypothetical protein